ncbi:MAG: hypothetical protein ACJAU3_001336 [Zhongshania sp.]|jgi:hypothetical protein
MGNTVSGLDGCQSADFSMIALLGWNVGAAIAIAFLSYFSDV